MACIYFGDIAARTRLARRLSFELGIGSLCKLMMYCPLSVCDKRAGNTGNDCHLSVDVGMVTDGSTKAD
jgi:hypothetical protein